MTPLEHFRAGQLNDAIRVLGEELRSHPLDAQRRTFLFELLCFAGEYDRAEKHLDLLADGGPNRLQAALLYRSALHAERTRQQMFRDGALPVASDELAASGTWNGQPFEELSDADPRIGDHLEVFIAGSYTWIPTRFLRRLEIQPPQNLRDLLWASARLECTPDFRLQELGDVLLPVLAPGSAASRDDQVRLGRVTVWEDLPGGGERPLGQKLMLIDGEEIPLLALRTMVWNTEPNGSKQGETDAPA
jgi:type VI secretion system protein ImpE